MKPEFEMPRSFLVKRRKSETDLLPEGELDKELASSSTGIPMHYRCLEHYSPRKLLLEYHPPPSQYIPTKACVSCDHGNRGPCYLSHHSNIIPPSNGCITYAPIPVSPSYTGMCFCLICQQRATTLSCNCQSCLSQRFEQTAASVLRQHGKGLSIKPACCSAMTCKSIPAVHPYPQFCHCIECISKYSKDSRLKNHVGIIVNKQERDKPEIITQIDRDSNNNLSKNEEHTKADNLRDGIKTPCKKDVSPGSNNLSDNEQEKAPCGETHNKKRRHEDEVLFVSKAIKTETVEGKCKLLETEDHLVEIVKEERSNEETNDEELSPINENKEWKSTSCQKTELYDNNDSDPSSRSSPENYYSDGFNYKDNRKLIKTNQHNNKESQNSKRHYNTRYTPTKTRSADKEYGSLKLKKDKDDYSEMKSISRQRTKLNRLLANEHERRRVAQLNSAYQSLRQLIPGYQCDTKLPKIKILRYAINYIAHLDNILEADAV